MKQTTRFLLPIGTFVLFLVVGGVLLSLTSLIPEGIPRMIFIGVFASAFAGVFLWLLAKSTRRVLLGPDRLWFEVFTTALNFTLFILTFGVLYYYIGIIDSTAEGSPVVHHLPNSLYYSVVTVTTLGYGDFYPVGTGRLLAAIEALTGYLILGVLASTFASLLAKEEEKEEEEETSKNEEQ
jgi:hypothetical protein